MMMAMIQINKDTYCINTLMKSEIVVYMTTHDYTQDNGLPFVADCLLRRVHTIPIMRPTIIPTTSIPTSIPTPVLAATTIMPELLDSVSTNMIFIQNKYCLMQCQVFFLRQYVCYLYIKQLSSQWIVCFKICVGNKTSSFLCCIGVPMMRHLVLSALSFNLLFVIQRETS